MQTGVVFLCWPPRLCHSALVFVIFSFVFQTFSNKLSHFTVNWTWLKEVCSSFIHSCLLGRERGCQNVYMRCRTPLANSNNLIVTYVLWPGKADRHLCEVILNELKQAVSKTTGDPIRWVLLFIVTGNPTRHFFPHLGLGRRLGSLSLNGHGFCLEIGRCGPSLPGASSYPPLLT